MCKGHEALEAKEKQKLGLGRNKEMKKRKTQRRGLYSWLVVIGTGTESP